MLALNILFAAGSFTLIHAAPITAPVLTARSGSTYVNVFTGTGAISEGWPSQDQWIASFDDMFDNQNDILTTGCDAFNVPNNSADEIASLKSAISSVGASSGIDPRYILAIVMQESNGCVRVPTTNFGVRNPGLMQTHDGTGTCNDPAFGGLQNPCPPSAITQMVADGTNGTPEGDGLKQLLAQAGTSDSSQFYIAARLYNSGSVAAGGNLGQGVATHCYSTDVANRLVGWSEGNTGCDADTVGTAPVVNALFSGPVNTVSSGTTTSSSAPAPTAALAPSPTPSASAAPVVTGASGTTGSTTADVSPVDASVPAPVTDSGSSFAAATACPTPGQFNCIDGSSFQQCTTAGWSTVQALAAGTQCTPGQSANLGITSS